MNHVTSKSGRLLLAIFILTSSVGCDQATKHLATSNLRGTAPLSYFADSLRFEYALNPGGFLSLGDALPAQLRFWLFTAANGMMLGGVAFVLAKNWKMPLAIFVALLYCLAGGIGNLIDRVLNDGLVTDFIVMGVGPLRTGIFNVADVAVTCGALALLLGYKSLAPATARPDTASPQ